MRRWTWLWIASALWLCGSCAQHTETAKTPLTEHQRDSVLAKSQLPGAFVVGRAMSVSDKVANAPTSQMPPDDSNGSNDSH